MKEEKEKKTTTKKTKKEPNLTQQIVAAKKNFREIKHDKKHYHGTYASLGSIYNAIGGPLGDQGVDFYHRTVESDGKLYVETVLTNGVEERSARVGIVSNLNGSVRNVMEAIGASITYAKRYSLCMALGISADDSKGDDLASAENSTSFEPVKPEVEKPAQQKPQLSLDAGNFQTKEELRAYVDSKVEQGYSFTKEDDKKIRLLYGKLPSKAELKVNNSK